MTAPLPQSPEPSLSDVGQWHASLQLTLQRRRGGTRLTHSTHSGPLYIQKPFYPEGPECAHVYLLHPPGGIVSGDCLQVEVLADELAGILVTTPGAARAYRARESNSLQRQSTRLSARQVSCIEWFPLETFVYDGACVEVETQVELEDGAHCALWEVSCLGLTASDAPFLRGRFSQRYAVTQGGRPVFVDGFTLDESNISGLAGPAGLRQQPVTGFFLMGPFADEDWEQRLHALRETPLAQQYQDDAALTRVGDYCVGRYLGRSAEHARGLFAHWWSLLRPQLLGRPASPPRIWLT